MFKFLTFAAEEITALAFTFTFLPVGTSFVFQLAALSQLLSSAPVNSTISFSIGADQLIFDSEYE